MNRRTLKKHCKRAMKVLIERHGFPADSFHPADGDETLEAPNGMERRFVRRIWLEPGPLPGTMLLWLRTSYECEEWDCELPSETLATLEFHSCCCDDFMRPDEEAA